MSELFSPFSLRGMTLRNRAVVSPMCQYMARNGYTNDWHLVHLGRFALGGFSLVIVEATGVTPEGRISYGCTGLWEDGQIANLSRIVDFLHSQGAAAGIQLAHAGRKASVGIPWRGGVPETEQDKIDWAYTEWQPVAPSAVPHADGYKVPHELTEAEIADLVQSFADAARRADQAGFDVIEIHGAHGYLIDQFLSPFGNHRTDKYGGARENRMRFALEVAAAIRAVWPAEKPLFIRLSVQDWHPDGWQVDDSIVLARELKALGVDLIDCSSGGFAQAKIAPAPLYQVPLAEAVREGAGMPTMAIGLVLDPEDAEAIVAGGKADLVAFARPALEDPNWAVHARHALQHEGDPYQLWAKPVGYAIRSKDRVLGARP